MDERLSGSTRKCIRKSNRRKTKEFLSLIVWIYIGRAGREGGREGDVFVIYCGGNSTTFSASS